MKIGLSFSITHEFGETDNSQSVQAYKASIVLSEETPAARYTKISAVAAVLSSIFLILIFPLSFAFRIESIKAEVVRPNGISVIRNILFPASFSILARIFTTPPRNPSLYFDTSIIPPVGKSGYKTKSSFFK